MFVSRLAQPGETHGDAVFAEVAVFTNRAGAVVSEPIVATRKPDAISIGAADPG